MKSYFSGGTVLITNEDFYRQRRKKLKREVHFIKSIGDSYHQGRKKLRQEVQIIIIIGDSYHQKSQKAQAGGTLYKTY